MYTQRVRSSGCACRSPAGRQAVSAMHTSTRYIGLVSLSVRKVYCGKTAEWIWMPFRVVGGVARVMGVLDGVVIASVTARGSFGGE